jgi:acyl-CoA synthetase (AMP-forming)/AMP-acid ligase II
MHTLRSMAEFVVAHATATPDRTAATDERTSLSYAALLARVRSTAHFLLGQGVRPGDTVAALVGPGCDGLVLLLAVNAVRATWLGLNTKYKYREMQYVAQDSGAKFLFFVSSFRERSYGEETGRLLAECRSLTRAFCIDGDETIAPSIRHVLRDEGPVDSPALDELLFDAARGDDTAMLVYTSGSSGQPKGVIIPNKAMIRRTQTQISQLPMDDYPRVLNAYPMNHVGGVHWVTCYALVSGGTVNFRESFDAKTLPGLIEEARINVLQIFPAMYQMLLDEPSFRPEKLRGVQWHFFSGAAISETLLAHVRSWGGRIITSYGMSETCGSVTYGGPGMSDEMLSNTIGKATPPGEVRVVGKDGAPCREGEVGEMHVRRDFGMQAYFKRPEQTAQAFTEDGWFKTGDLALVMAEGNLRFVGRLSEMFKSGGYNVYPREIELVLEAHAAVSLAAVVVCPHQVFGEVGAAFVTPKPGMALNPADLKLWCKEHLADYKIPKFMEVRAELPLLPIGKVDKVLLRSSLAAAPAH